MLEKPLTRDDLCTFLSVKDRGLSRVLRALGIRLRGGTTRWPVVFRALGLAEVQDPAHHVELGAPLLEAKDVATLLGVTTSVIYRWEKGRLPAGAPPFPCSIDLSNGRDGARAKRWRKAEVLAWHEDRPLPQYAQPAPTFGALTPTK